MVTLPLVTKHISFMSDHTTFEQWTYLQLRVGVGCIWSIESQHVCDTASRINPDALVLVIHDGGVDQLFGD